MDVVGGRSAGFGRIGGELRASTYTPLMLPSASTPSAPQPAQRRSAGRSWLVVGTAVALAVVAAVLASVVFRARPSVALPPAVGDGKAAVDVRSAAPPAAPSVARPRD